MDWRISLSAIDTLIDEQVCEVVDYSPAWTLSLSGGDIFVVGDTFVLASEKTFFFLGPDQYPSLFHRNQKEVPSKYGIGWRVIFFSLRSTRLGLVSQRIVDGPERHRLHGFSNIFFLARSIGASEARLLTQMRETRTSEPGQISIGRHVYWRNKPSRNRPTKWTDGVAERRKCWITD